MVYKELDKATGFKEETSALAHCNIRFTSALSSSLHTLSFSLCPIRTAAWSKFITTDLSTTHSFCPDAWPSSYTPDIFVSLSSSTTRLYRTRFGIFQHDQLTLFLQRWTVHRLDRGCCTRVSCGSVCPDPFAIIIISTTTLCGSWSARKTFSTHPVLVSLFSS